MLNIDIIHVYDYRGVPLKVNSRDTTKENRWEKTFGFVPREGRVAELAYAHGSEPCLARGEGSTPSSSTHFVL